MKLATYRRGQRQSFGVIGPEGVLDVPAAWPGGPRRLLEALQGGREVLAEIRRRTDAAGPPVPWSELQLLAPIPQPPKVLGLAVNYAAHHREFSRGGDLPDDSSKRTTPRPFLMPATAVTGPGAEIPWPAFSREVDYEVELAVVIGTSARCVAARDAAAYVAGYTIANDVSARTVTHAEGRAERPKDAFFDWLHGKWSDGFCPLGPCLATAEEIGDPQGLKIQSLVNGEVRQDADTGQMIHSVGEVVSFLSHLMTLRPGDVIATGTPAGVGMPAGRLLGPGDTVTCRIEKIGELTNTMGPMPGRFYAPCRDGF